MLVSDSSVRILIRANLTGFVSQGCGDKLMAYNQRNVLSPLQRPESRCQRTMLSLTALRESTSLPLPRVWWVPASLGLPRLEDPALSLGLHIYMTYFSVSLCVSSPLCKRTSLIGSGCPRVQYDLMLTNNRCRDTISK